MRPDGIGPLHARDHFTVLAKESPIDSSVWFLSLCGSYAAFAKAVKLTPMDRLLVETDAPYLAPGKFRGKRNEPSYVVEVARVLAETRGVTLEEISRQTTENFFRLFSKVPTAKATA